MLMSIQDRFMRFPEYLATTGLSRTSAYRLAAQGLAPKPHKIGPRAVGFSQAEVQAFIESRKNPQ